MVQYGLKTPQGTMVIIQTCFLLGLFDPQRWNW